jgi:hypothetical protein
MREVADDLGSAAGARHTIQLTMRASATAPVPRTGGPEGDGDEEDL